MHLVYKMNKEEFDSVLNRDVDYINEKIKETMRGLNEPRELSEAMAYSLQNGGKRVRPVLCLEFAKALGAKADDAANFALAVEFIHTYSLIHDDMPEMDNDDMRRGELSCHKKFGAATALLAGDTLLTEAFNLVASAPLSPESRAAAVSCLSKKSGIFGMAGGQMLDLQYEKEKASLEETLNMYGMKTSALLQAACVLGCIAAGASESKIKAAEAFAMNLGLAFQIKDDLLDITGETAIIGKPAGSDKKNDKNTVAELLGVEKATEEVTKYTTLALEALGEFENTEFIEKLSLQLISREK